MEKGLIHIYTGDGKGKTTASVGLAIRAAGHGLKVLFVQFFKEDKAPSGEKDIFRDFVSNIELIRSNSRHPFFTGKDKDDETLRASIRGLFETVKERAAPGEMDLIVLDEVMSAVNGGWIETEELIEFLTNRPESLEVAMTGREAPVALVAMADYVTEMLKIKHPFDSGVKAREGIEF